MDLNDRLSAATSRLHSPWWGLLFITFSLLAFPLKALWVSKLTYTFTQTFFLGFFNVIINDAWSFGFMLACLLCSIKTTNTFYRIGLAALFYALWIVHWVDLTLLFNFNNRLNIIDSLKYTQQVVDYIPMLASGKSITFLLLMGLSFIASLIILFYTTRHAAHFYPKRWRKVFLFAIVCSPFLLLFQGKQQYIHAWMYQNVFTYNHDVQQSLKAYSPQFIHDILKKTPPLPACQTSNIVKPKHIVLLMVESLSSYQSQFFSGIYNWTPHLDTIAKQNAAFTQFYANGFNTEDGEIALLTGLPPLTPVGLSSAEGGMAFQGYFHYPEALPLQLKTQGYHSYFYTSADLQFANTENWAKSIGFNTILGSENPAFNGLPRFNFSSVADEHLLHFVAEHVKHNTQPSFYFIKTVSTHHPYQHPVTGEHSPESVFRYTDEQIGHFYTQLQQQHFFEEGILMIVGDHRAMLPISAPEIKQFGAARAPAKIPLIVVDPLHTLPAQYASPQQQTDVYYSILQRTQQQNCQYALQGNILGAVKPAPYVLFKRGEQRNVVSAFTTHNTYQVSLKGDRTSILLQRQKSQQPINTLHTQHILDHVNTLRIRATQRMQTSP